MRYFLTEDGSSDHHTLVDLRQRALWICLTLILQALNEIDHHWYFPFVAPFGSLIPLAFILGSFYTLWMALRPGGPPRLPLRWQQVILVLTLILAVVGGVLFGRSIWLSLLPPEAAFTNDGTTLDTNAAILLLEGRNPYTDSNIPEIVRKFPIKASWTTPLREGQFADRLEYPTEQELEAALAHTLQTGSAPEFEAKVSYPALAFLPLIPFVLMKHLNVLPFFLVSYLVLIAIAWKVARPALRPWVLLLGLANVPMWASTVGGNLDIFATLLIVLAWLLRERRWCSALFFGLALATKQTAWFLAPFYLIMIWRQYSLKETFFRLLIAGLLALAINLPFIIWHPQAWLAGVLTPIADPMFPLGVGIINLSVTHLLPFFPPLLYTVIEVLVMLFVLIWYWRLSPRRPEAALFFAIIPLFFAWRSLPSYFYCAAYPVFVLLASNLTAHPAEKLDDTLDVHSFELTSDIGGIR